MRLYQFGVVLPLVVEPIVPEPSVVLVLPMEPVVDVPPKLPLVLLVLPVPLVRLPVPDERRIRLLDDLPREERIVLLPVVLEPFAEVPD